MFTLQYMVVIETVQHFDRLSEQSILLFYKDMIYNEPKKKISGCEAG